MAASLDRLRSVCELLLGAAYADKEFHEREKEIIVKRLTELLDGDKLPPEIDATIEAFDANSFDLGKTCEAFAKDAKAEKKTLLELVAAVHDADDIYDLDEDEYLRKVAAVLELGDDDLKGLALSYEVEELSTKLRAVTAPPTK